MTDSEITTVDCPENLEIEMSGTLECTTEAKSGAALTIKVTQRDSSSMEWEVMDNRDYQRDPSGPGTT
jgi:Domain of unknown function (DUF4333)